MPRLVFACFLEALAIFALAAISELSLRVFAASSLLAVAIVLVYFTLFQGGLVLFVHEYGIKIVRGVGREEVALFSQVSRVFSANGEKIRLVLELSDRRRLVIEGCDEELRPSCDAIVERVTGVIAPRVAADFYAGEVVDFGAVRVCRALLSTREGRLPLRRVADAVIRRGRFVVIADDGRTFASIERVEIANLEALLMLLSRLRRPVAAGRSS